MTALAILIPAFALFVLYAGWRIVRMFSAGNLDEPEDPPELQPVARPRDIGSVEFWESLGIHNRQSFPMRDPEQTYDPTCGIIRLGAVPYEPPPKRIVRRTPPCLRRRLRR